MAVRAARPASVIENRPGGDQHWYRGGHACAAGRLHAALVDEPNAINATLYHKLNFNFIRDIAPVASIVAEPAVMVVNPSIPAKTVPEFIAYAKANPGKINMASAGTGTSARIWPASSSSSWLASTWFTCLIAVRRPDHRPARRQVQVVFGRWPGSISTSGPASCARWR